MQKHFCIAFVQRDVITTGNFCALLLSCESQNINKKSNRCLVKELRIFEIDKVDY
jgi:hypothetical protein